MHVTHDGLDGQGVQRLGQSGYGGSIHKKNVGLNKKNRLANRTAAGIKGLLPVLAHDSGKAEDKCPRPENVAGTGDQDECPSKIFYHNDSNL